MAKFWCFYVVFIFCCWQCSSVKLVFIGMLVVVAVARAAVNLQWAKWLRNLKTGKKKRSSTDGCWSAMKMQWVNGCKGVIPHKYTYMYMSSICRYASEFHNHKLWRKRNWLGEEKLQSTTLKKGKHRSTNIFSWTFHL